MELIEYRCECGKLLFKGMLRDGMIEVKCRSCHVLTRWEESPNPHNSPLYMVKASNERETDH